MIAIVNVSGPDGNGEHSYSVRINRDEICRFTHRREDGLELCLFMAAQAVQKRNSLTMADIARLEGLLTRALGVLYPEPDPLDEQALLDSLQGLTTDEIRKANRRRNAAIKAKQKEQKK